MYKGKKPKAILVDFDGVINKSKYFSYIYSEKYSVPLEDVQKIFVDGRKDLTNIGKADLKEVMEGVLTDWKWEGTAWELIDLWFRTDFDIDMRVIDLIQKLRRSEIKCYVASDQEKYRTEYLWNEKKISQYFDGRFISYEIGYVKLQSEFFEFVIKELRLPENDILFIDDSRDKLDIAKQVGIKPYFYNSFNKFEAFIRSISG